MKTVFIGGCGRSGTTMLGETLGRLQGCLTTPESHFKFMAYKSAISNDGSVDIEKAMSIVLQSHQAALWKLESNSICDIDSYTRYEQLLIGLVESYGRKINNKEFLYWIDHTPNNIANALTISEWFPDAKFIHIVRDGRAVANSVIPLDWGPNTIEFSARWWVQSVGHAVVVEQSLPSDCIMRIKYEDIVFNQEDSLTRICDFLQISHRTKDTPGFDVPSYTSRQHSLVGKPPNPKRINAWQLSLTKCDIQAFEHEVGDLLAALGYESFSSVPFSPPSSINKIGRLLREVTRMTVNKLRHRYRVIRHASTKDM